MLNFIHVPAALGQPSITPRKDIDQLFAELDQQDLTEIVLYFHGGLNTFDSARATAERIHGELNDPSRHVVSLIWETGAGETLLSQLTRLINVSWMHKLVALVQKRTEKHISPTAHGTPGVLGVPSPGKPSALDEDADLDALKKELEQEYAADLHRETGLVNEVQNDIRTREEEFDESFVASASTQPQPGTLGIGPLDFLKIPVKVTIEVIKRMRAQLDHGLVPTIIEELLREVYAADLIKGLWDDMKLRAAEMWRPRPDEPEKPAAYFLQQLATYREKHPDLKIDLIGHSAGSIVICHLLATADWEHPQLRFRNVVFLAPAVTMDLFNDEVITKPERYSRFRMFTMTDEFEMQDTVGWQNIVAYPHSLLYLVSGILERSVDTPLAGMVRFLAGVPPLDDYKLLRIGRFLHEPGRDRLILSQTGAAPPGLQSGAITHGDFDNDPQTLNSIKHMLAG